MKGDDGGQEREIAQLSESTLSVGNQDATLQFTRENCVNPANHEDFNIMINGGKQNKQTL